MGGQQEGGELKYLWSSIIQIGVGWDGGRGGGGPGISVE